MKSTIIFNMCKVKEGNISCAFCSDKKKKACQILFTLDKKYSDDPRNAVVDKEGRL